MNKNRTRTRIAILAVGLVLAGGSFAFVQAGQVGRGNQRGQGLRSQQLLSVVEKESLIFMIEEEKLARDVYVNLASKWGVRPFGNIAEAEQTHMNAVRTILVRHAVSIPSEVEKPGVFKNKELQQLHDKLIKAGSVSRIEALKVGATIEDLDLYDLARWQKDINNPDIKRVFDNLAKGSRNHLRSFVRSLTVAGSTYEAQYLTKAEFLKIVNSQMERGPG